MKEAEQKTKIMIKQKSRKIKGSYMFIIYRGRGWLGGEIYEG